MVDRKVNTMSAAISKASFALTLASAIANAIGCHSEHRSYEVINGTIEIAKYKGRQAVHLVAPPDKRTTDMHLLAIASGSNFTEGTIRVDVAGSPFDDASEARGFIGVAFHVEPHGSRYESFYLRPTNGRAQDQLRRNHTTQYVSYPDFPWQELRKSRPGVYESYADIEPGAWTALRVVVRGKTAKLYVNEADQPTLIVNDLKLGESGGQVALWSHATTDGYFSYLQVISN
jgi:hypothetical protein